MRARNYVLIVKLLSSKQVQWHPHNGRGKTQRYHTTQIRNFNGTLKQCNIYNLVLQDHTYNDKMFTC